jgi:DNA-binding NtrC family response regulator
MDFLGGLAVMPRAAKSLGKLDATLCDHVLPPWIVGISERFLQVVEQVRRLAHFDVTVLVRGETGVGKEIIVRLLHYLSSRSDNAFVPVNAGAIPEGLFEDELFGHAAGAFTGARGTSAGLVALAERGTLFLDEIDALRPHAQAALLRFLQDGCYRPVGGRGLARSDVRIITSTNADPQKLVERGMLREDLYFRLSGITLWIPPLRERREDILPLANFFLDELNARHGQAPARKIGEPMQAWLTRHDWPGNVRELRSVVEHSFIMSPGAELLPPGDATDDAQPAAEDTFQQAKQRVIGDFERRFLIDALRRSHGNISIAARAVGKERKAFYRLLRRYQIDCSAYRPDTRPVA